MPVQEWDGYVIEIRRHEFVARLLDITADAKREEEEATISFDEISSKDRETMRLGSIFRWVIGYEHTVGGVERRVSHIVFRQFPFLRRRIGMKPGSGLLRRGECSDWNDRPGRSGHGS